MNEDDFLRAIRANPADESAWLGYAEWLRDRNDPRAEYLRLWRERERITVLLDELAERLDSAWVGLLPGAWRVLLTSYPPQLKIHAIKLVRELNELGLREAKDLVESVPSVVAEGLTQTQANQLKRRFEADGLTVVIEPFSTPPVKSARAALTDWMFYRVILRSYPPERKIMAVKLVREVTGLGLKESLDLVNAAPCMIRESVTAAQAEQIQSQFQQAGLTITVEPAGEVAPLPVADTGERYRLTLTDCPPRRKSALTRLVRQLTGVGLREARAMIEELPNTLRRGLTRAEADHARELFDAERIPLLIESEGEGS
jgi:large subunit ribosomal protein L7/L12